MRKKLDVTALCFLDIPFEVGSPAFGEQGIWLGLVFGLLAGEKRGFPQESES